jgi:diguanylate cyclase (GGDEF)-like protein
MNRPIFNALMLFLLPALLVAVIVAGLNFFSLRYINEQQIEGAQQIKQGLHVLDEMIGLVVQVGLLHDNVSRQLTEAENGRLDEAGAYQIHVLVIDHLATVDNNRKALLTHLQQKRLNSDQLQLWSNTFEDYRNLVIMATDIVAIEPKTAENYIQKAQSSFFNLSSQTFSLSSQLSDTINQEAIENQNAIRAQFNKTYWILALAIFMGLWLAIISARYLSRHLQTLIAQLNLLAHNPNLPQRLPMIEVLSNSSSQEIRQLAQTVLNLHRALKEKAQEQEHINQLLFQDMLTGLPNRTRMITIVNEKLQTADESTRALIKLNINRLKIVNDGLGHDFGDLLITEVGKRLQSMTNYEAIARNAGDEFILLTKPLTEADTLLPIMLHQLHEQIRPSFLLQEHTVNISISVGATCFQTNTTLSATDIFTQAMIALHEAKHTADEHSLIYDPSLELKAKKRIHLTNELRQALMNDHLRLYAQPQVNSRGIMTSAEILIRWVDPEKGMIPPNEFIPFAEESDLIIEIDRWVLLKSCQQLKILQQIQPDFSLSVNISAKHFALANFVNMVYECLENTQVDAKGLIIEITEGAMLHNVDSVIEKMQQLQQLGIRFAIDDFGTGYSSLQYLKRLPIYELKIDKSFIDHLPEDTEDIALTQSMIAIAKNLNLHLVIEGIEHQAQLDYLSQFGEFLYQGYYFAKPQPIQQIFDQLS